MKTITLLLIFLLGSSAIAQTIVSDSKGNEMFNFYTGNSLTIELETGKDELNINYNLPLKKSFSYYSNPAKTAAGGKDTTIFTSVNLQFAAKFFNGNGDIDYGNFANNRVGIEITLGVQRSIDKIFNIALLQAHSQPFWSFGANLSLRRDNLLLYDSVKLKESEEHPVSTSLNFNLTGYRWVWMAAQFSGTIGFKGWNIDDLPSYFSNMPTFSNPEIITFDNDIRGKYGQLESDSFIQLRFANPFFPFYQKDAIHKNIFSKLSFTPYLTAKFSKEASPDYRYGIMMNVLGQSISQVKGYTIEKGFGIGVDKSDFDKNPVLFLRGTFNFGEILPSKRGAGNAH